MKSKSDSDKHSVYYNNELIGTVRRIRWSSGSATTWKAQGIGWYFTIDHCNTKEFAIRSLIHEYKKQYE